jgi:hypothetical protein
MTNVPDGSTIVIQGTVTDQSPGKPGTPAIADNDQNAWMNYLYEQQPKPDHAAGVPVKLTATGPDGSHVTIGTATSDTLGHYSMTWTTSGQGLFTIAAEFEGTNSYWGSTAETSIVVGAAAGSGTTTTSAAPIDLYIIVATIVILIAIALATVVIRRKA